MADINKLSPLVRKWEGGLVDDKDDKGGITNMGITLPTWKQVGYDKDGDFDIDGDDIKLLTPKDFNRVLKIYWDRWKADQIKNQSVANILVDWVYNSGKWGVVIPQRILNIKDDGIVGSQTINAVNSANQEDFFNRVYARRKMFFENIASRFPKQKKFLKGWLNRLSDFKYEP